MRYDRTEYLTQMFSSLQTVPGVEEYKIYISQDGQVQGVGQVIDKKIVGGSGLNVTHLQHFGNEGKRTKSTPKTMLIARHYGWGNIVYFHHILPLSFGSSFRSWTFSSNSFRG